MSKVVNFKGGQQPTQKQESFVDGRGQRHFKFQFEYHHDGRDWDFTIWAKSEEDAYAKLNSLVRTSLLVDPKPGAAS